MAPRKKKFALIWWVGTTNSDVLPLSKLPKQNRNVGDITTLLWQDFKTKKTTRSNAKIVYIGDDEKTMQRLLVNSNGELHDPMQKIFSASVVKESDNLKQQMKITNVMKTSNRQQYERKIEEDLPIVTQVPIIVKNQLTRKNIPHTITSENKNYCIEGIANYPQNIRQINSYNSLQPSCHSSPMTSKNVPLDTESKDYYINQNEVNNNNLTQSVHCTLRTSMNNFECTGQQMNYPVNKNQANHSNSRQNTILTSRNSLQNIENQMHNPMNINSNTHSFDGVHYVTTNIPRQEVDEVRSFDRRNYSYQTSHDESSKSSYNTSAISQNKVQSTEHQICDPNSEEHNDNTFSQSFTPRSQQIQEKQMFDSISIQQKTPHNSLQYQENIIETHNVNKNNDENITETQKTDKEDDEDSSESNDDEGESLDDEASEIIQDFLIKNVTKRDIIYHDMMGAAMKQAFAIQNRKKKINSRKSLTTPIIAPMLPSRYFTKTDDATELSPHCGFYLPTSKFTYYDLKYDNHQDWQVLVREVLLEVYDDTIKDYCATGKGGGRPAIDHKLFKGLLAWVNRRTPIPVERSAFIQCINKFTGNKRKYRKEQEILSSSLKKPKVTQKKKNSSSEPTETLMHSTSHSTITVTSWDNDNEQILTKL